MQMAGLKPPVYKGRGILNVLSNAEMVEAEKRAAEEAQSLPYITGLAAYLNHRWQTARDAKQIVEKRLLNCLRRRKGEYDPDKLQAIKAAGLSEIYMMLTSIKCRALESWISDILLPGDEEPWEIEPTPIPELPGHIEQQIQDQVAYEAAYMAQMGQAVGLPDIDARIQEIKDELNQRLRDKAQSIADRMTDKIDDQLTEGDWEKALREFISDVATYPTAFLKGPVIRRRKQLTWRMREGKWKPVVTTKLVPVFYRISPFDMYPSASSRSVNDGYLFERHRLRHKDLLAMKGVPGYDDDAIDMVISEYSVGGLREWLSGDITRARLEGRQNEYLETADTIDALEFTGRIPGKLLREWGVENVQDNMDYDANAWMIGNYVIRAVLNDDPLGRRNYYSASFEQVPGSLWGQSPPEIMSDLEDMCNAAARALQNNMAFASGPMVEVEVDRLASGESVTEVTPWRVFQSNSDPNTSGNKPAIRFYQPSLHAEPLLKVYEHFSRLADEYTGIPAYTYGDPSASGAGKTASGLSMLMTAASRGIKKVISHIDGPIEQSVTRIYEYNMLYDEDDSIKGDVMVKAKGSRTLIAKEQMAIRRNEFLQQTANPLDFQIMTPQGRAEVLRAAAASLELEVDKVVPDQVMQQMQQAMMAEVPQPGMPQQPGMGQELDPAGNPVAGQDMALFQGAA